MQLADKLNNLAVSLMKSNKETSFALLKRVVDLNPTEANKCNLAIAYTNQGQYAEASRLLYDIVLENPSSLRGWHAYGVLNLVAALPEDAVKCFERCMELDPLNKDHEFDYSLALMQAGQWEKGLEAYEIRTKWKPEATFGDIPKWDGSEGRSIYVWAEQGVGDTFQFARFLPWLSSISKRVVLAIPPDLQPLFEGYRQYCEFIGTKDQVEGIECETSMMSLALHWSKKHKDYIMPEDPCLLGADLVPMDLPSDDRQLKIGLCWACNPNSYHYRERSIPFEDMLQLVEHSGADFYSLQVGKPSADIALADAQIVVNDLSNQLTNDWTATASAIKALDMVVTTDTSVAHLAAILQKPTLMLIARRDWWRWGNYGTTTFWYPSMTIIRQSTPFKWGQEIRQVSAIIGQAVRDRCAKINAA